MSDDDQDERIKALTSFISKKGILTVANPLTLEDYQPFNIKDTSFLRILSMIEEDTLVHWINCDIIDEQGLIKRVDTKRLFEVKACYLNIIDEVKEFYVIHPEFVDLTEEQKAEGTIKVNSESFSKIMRMAKYNWVEFLNFLSIVITQVMYSNVHKLMRSRSKILPKYIKLLDYIMLYIIKYKENKEIEITSYSINKILNMIGLDIYNLTDFMNLNLITITYEEIFSKKARYRFLKRRCFVLGLKKEVTINEGTNILKLRASTDTSYKLRRQTLFFLDNDTMKGLDIIKNNKLIKQKKKEEIDSEIEKDDTFIEVEDENEQKVLIRKKIYKEIISSSNTVEVNETTDYYGNNVKVHKSKLVSRKDNDENEYFKVQVNTEQEDKKIILVLKKTMATEYQKWTTVRKVVEIENKLDNKLIMVQLDQLTIVPLDNTSLQLQAEFVKMLNEKKAELFQKDISLLEFEEKKLIKSNLYEKITEHSGVFDEFNVKNHYDGNNVIVSKRKFKSKPKNNYAEYVEIIYNGKRLVVKKTDLETVLNQWNGVANKILLKNYCTGKDEEIDLLKTKASNEIKEEEELPYQEGEAKETKERITKDITEENEFYMVPSAKAFIKASLINEIISKHNDAESDVYTVVDNNNIKRKLARTAVLADELVPFIEIVETETKRKKYVKKKALEKGLEDLTKDDIQVEDEKGVIIHVKKSKIQVVKQTKATINIEAEQMKNKILKQIKINFVSTQDENAENTIIRKEYLSLVSNHKQSTPFDRYEITNANRQSVFISKKSFMKINPESLEEFVKIQNIKDSRIHYASKSSLMKYLKDDYDIKENETLELDEYDSNKNQNKLQYVLTKMQIPIQDIHIVEEESNFELQQQKEEILMKNLIQKRLAAKESNNETDFVQIKNQNDKPIIIRKKIIEEIIRVNKTSQFPRTVFKVMNSITNQEDKINIANINSDSSNTSDVFCLISIPSMNKKSIFINKNQLRDCLNKADNPRCNLDCIDYVTNQKLNQSNVVSFEYEKVDNVSLPIQDQIKLQNTVVVSSDLDRVTTTKDYNPIKSIRPESVEITDENDVAIDINEEDSPLKISETSAVSMPNIKQKEKRFYVIRRAVIRRIRIEN